MFREQFDKAPWTTSGQEETKRLERLSQSILPYIEQTRRYQRGMKYQTCPEVWRPQDETLNSMKTSGREIGSELTQLGLRIPEFRIDFVKPNSRQPQVLEIDASQDRGLPEMAILENAYLGQTRTATAFCRAVRLICPEAKLLTVVYPSEKSFYYAPYEDFGRFCRTSENSLEVWPVSINQVVDEKGSFEVWKQGGRVTRTPDAVLDYTARLNPDNTFDIVNKNLIADFYQRQVPGVPPTFIGTELPQDVFENQQRWIVKPIDQQWGQGIKLGLGTNTRQWKRSLAAVKESRAIAQRFYPSEVIYFPVRERKNGAVTYPREAFNLRLEGYYFLTPDGYQMQGAMVTGLPVDEGNIVHGKRSCIMIPAKL